MESARDFLTRPLLAYDSDPPRTTTTAGIHPKMGDWFAPPFVKWEDFQPEA